MSVTEPRTVACEHTENRNGVTEPRKSAYGHTQNRNGPVLTCKVCCEIAAADQPVYIGTFQHHVFTWQLPICTPCWTGKPNKRFDAIVHGRRGDAVLANFVQLVAVGYCSGEQPPRPCVWCRRPVVIGYPARRIACSDRCRTYARRDHQRQQRIDFPDVCQECRSPMPGCPRHKRFCSNACRQKSYRQRTADRIAERAEGARLLREYEAGIYGGAP